MSKGSKNVIVRFPDDLLRLVGEAVSRRNDNSRGAEWTLSDWVRAACLDKLKHAARSRRSRKRTKTPAEGTT